jgi:hypothetical protein
MQGLDSLFGGLLGGKTGLFMSAFRLRRVGLLQISLRLGQPVFGTIRHNSLPRFILSGLVKDLP